MLNPLSPYLANTSITRKFYIRYIMVGEFNSNSNTSNNSLKGKSDFFDSIVTCYFIDTANNIMKIWMDKFRAFIISFYSTQNEASIN